MVDMSLFHLILAGGTDKPDPLGIHGSTFLWTIITFIGLVFILSKFAWKPIVNGLKAREEGIRGDIEAAEGARVKAEEMLSKYEDKLNEARKEVEAIMAEGRKDAERLVAEEHKKAQDEAQLISDRAKRDINLAKEAALEDLRSQSIELAMTVAEKVIEKSLKASDHKGLIKQTISDFESAGA